MDESKKLQDAEDKLRKYEENGVAKLYYALSRKSWEMADMLNSINLKTLDLGDKNDKTFERLRFIINDSSGIAAAVKSLGELAGITGDEKKDIERKPFNDRIAEERR